MPKCNFFGEERLVFTDGLQTAAELLFDSSYRLRLGKSMPVVGLLLPADRKAANIV